LNCKSVCKEEVQFAGGRWYTSDSLRFEWSCVFWQMGGSAISGQKKEHEMARTETVL